MPTLGLDAYDPTTGEIRSDTTDDIACWFVGSDYNEESFFVWHAYFTRTVGRPFEAPADRRDHRENHQSLRG